MARIGGGTSSDGDRACIHGLKFQTRTIAAQASEGDLSHFLVGSVGNHGDNEIHLLEFDEDRFDVTYKIYRHPGQVWDLAPCPAQGNLLFTVHRTAGANGIEHGATLWSLENCGFDDRTVDCELKPLLSLGAHDATGVRQVLWNPNGDISRVVSIDGSYVRLWSLDKLAAVAQTEAAPVPPSAGHTAARAMAAAWSPHSAQQITTASDRSLHGWDLRSLKQTYVIDHVHELAVRTVDYNPNRPNVLATGGDDGFLRIWDTRQPKEALVSVRHHKHWIWQVAFNRFHDQLILTGGSDGRVKLENIFSVSSAATLRVNETAEGADENAAQESDSSARQDALIRSYDQHDDSVYAVAWSATDPWVFASASYDGHVVINVVPEDEKYKIML